MKCETCNTELKDSLEKVSNCTMEIRTPIIGLDTDDGLLFDWENEIEEEVLDGIGFTLYECKWCGNEYTEAEVREVFK